MILKKCLLGLFFFLAFFQISAQRKIVIVGKIANYKSGVSVISDKTGKYYVIRKYELWDEEMVGKKIKVWGILKLEKSKPFKIKSLPKTENEPPPPQIATNFYGIRRLILNAKWKLL